MGVRFATLADRPSTEQCPPAPTEPTVHLRSHPGLAGALGHPIVMS
jgi:hypothetical protein